MVRRLGFDAVRVGRLRKSIRFLLRHTFHQKESPPMKTIKPSTSTSRSTGQNIAITHKMVTDATKAAPQGCRLVAGR
jgi:hypothetical protein